jgi:glycosyltransferase involved in cell wall biosynthesis
MRRWDFKAAQRPDRLVANSNFTSQQIKKYYGRDSTVIYPPVDVENFKLPGQSSNLRKGFIIAGRQTPYKRFDLAVAACTKLNLPLTVIGNGPDHQRLQKMAGPTVKFTGRIPTNEVIKYFQSAEAFIFPGLDDFGVVAVEAMAAGCPVVAYNAGGALDYIEPDKTGVFFNSQTADDLAKALQSFDSRKFDSKYISAQARRFSESNFRKNLNQLLADYLEK